jgi:solute carrier family 35, member F5
LISDLTWAYAVLYTSPLIVTIGLSLSIPLSIVGQFFLNNQSATLSYFFGAVVVFAAFIFINHESQPEIVSEERRREE